MSVTVTGIKRHLDLNSSTLTTTGNVTVGGDLLLDLNDNIRFGNQLAITKENNGELKLYGGTNSTDGGFEFFTWNGSAYESSFTLKNNQNARFEGQVGIGTDPASGVELHINGDVRVDSTEGVATRKIRSGYFSSTQDIVVASGSSASVRLQNGSTDGLVIDSSQNADFTGHVGIAASKYLEFHGQGKLINFDVSSWTNASEHNLLYAGWLSNTGDYLSFKVPGNSTTGHGNLIIGDNGLWFGRMNTTDSAAATNSATNPHSNSGSNYFRVDTSGNAVFSGSVTANGTTLTGDQDLSGYALTSHNHDDRYYTETEIDGFGFLTSSSTQSKYLRSDVNDTATGVIDFTGGFKPKHYGASSDLNNDTRTIFSTHAVNNATSNRPINYSSVYTLGGGTSNALQISTNEDYSESGMWIRQYNQNSASPQGTGWQNWAEVWTTNHASLGKIPEWNAAYTHSQSAHAPSDADATPSWVPSSDPGYLTSSSTQSKYLRSDTADTATGKITLEGNSAAWNTTTPGLTTGSLHFDPGVGTDHFGNAITFGASDSSNGTTAQAGIYLRTDGSYGSRMYFATTNSYNTGSKVAMYINHNKDVYFLDNINVAGDIVVSGTVDGVDIATLASNNTGTNTGDQDLSGLAPKASPALTGNPTAPTQSAGNNSTRIATTAFVSTAVSNLVGSAPATLDTLQELGDALGDDPNFATTTATSLGNRVRVDTNAQNLSNDQKSNARTNIGAGTSNFDGAYGSLSGVPSTFAPSTHNHDDRYYTESESDAKYLLNTTDTLSGNLTVTGDLTVQGVNYGLYHAENATSTESGSSSNYYHDPYGGGRHLSMFLKNARADIIRYRAIDNVEYWNGSSWQDGSSQLANVKKLLDGRQDTSWSIPSTYYKFRFTIAPSTSWPTTAKVGTQTSWTGSTYPGHRMIVEEYDGTSWSTRVTAKFGGNGTTVETTDNNCDNWGWNFISTNRLHTGNGNNTGYQSGQNTRITIDFYGWSPSNSSYTTIPMQNIFITSNFSGTENTDYTNLLDYDRNITTAGAINLGHASDTTIARSAAGKVTIEGNEIYHEGHKPTYSELGAMNYDNLTGTVPTWNQNTTGSAGSVPWSGISSKPTFVVNSALSSRSTAAPDTAGDGRGVTFNYMNGSASPAPTGTDHSLMTMAYSDAWQTQLAQDWREEGRMYVRGQENGTWSSWNQVWDSSDFAKADVLNSNVTLSSLGAAASSHNHDDRYYTETEMQTFFNRGYISKVEDNNLAVGWYTIATNTGDRATGMFQIWDTASSDHQSVIFTASHHFGTDSSNDITVLTNSRYSGTNFRYIRIKEAGTYNGAALQVYVDGTSNTVAAAIVGANAQESGWVLKDWVADSTDPGDVDNYSSFVERCKLDLDNIINGGIATTGLIYAAPNSGTATAQYRVLTQADEGAGNGIDADTLDGQHASAFQAAGSYAAASHTHTFASLTSKPTTISGYGITDAFDGAYGSLSDTPTIPSGNQIIDWTADQGTTNIHTGNYNNTQLSDSEVIAAVVASTNISSEDKGTIRSNIGAGSSSFSGAYADLTGKPTIPSGNQIIDWTTDQGSTNIHANNIPDLSGTYLTSLSGAVLTSGAQTVAGTKTFSSAIIANGGVAIQDISDTTITRHSAGHIETPLYRIFDDGYHPNADKWTTARTITLGGDLSGSVSIDGSANVTLTATVANDSHSHSNYITSNANDTVSANTTWNDGNQARFGTGGDLKIQHNGSNAYIDNNTGNLHIRTNVDADVGGNIYIRPHDNEHGIIVTHDSDVKLYHNNSQKFATTSGGISVTGTISATSTIGNKGTNIGQNLEYGTSSVATLRCDADRWRVYMGGGGYSHERFSVLESGNVGVGDSTPSYKLDVAGTIRATGDVIAYSDERVKENIKTIDNSLEKVNKLRGVEFNKIGEDKKSIGVIAQEIEKILPEVVRTDDEGMKSVAYGNVVGVLIEAVKELTKEVKELKKCNKCKNCNCNA